MAVRERVRGAGATGANKLSVLREIGLLAIEDHNIDRNSAPLALLAIRRGRLTGICLSVYLA